MPEPAGQAPVPVVVVSPSAWQTPLLSAVVLGGQTHSPAAFFVLPEPAGQAPVPVVVVSPAGAPAGKGPIIPPLVGPLRVMLLRATPVFVVSPSVGI